MMLMAVAGFPGVRFDRVPSDALPAVYALEAAAYPADEAATEENMRLRLAEANLYFRGAWDDGGALVGYVCGTLSHSKTLTEESMSVHEPDGTTLCIHSVVVAPQYRRKGLGAQMLRAYVAHVRSASPRVGPILLMCKVGPPKLQPTQAAELIISVRPDAPRALPGPHRARATSRGRGRHRSRHVSQMHPATCHMFSATCHRRR